MNALLVTLFVSGGLMAFGLLAFLVAFARRDHEHADRLSLLPLEEDHHDHA